MKRQLVLLVALLASSSLMGCGGKKGSSSSSSSELPSSSSIEPSSSSSSSTSIAPVMTGISINTDNVKKEYINGDALNLAGLVVTVNYSDGSSNPVTNYSTSPANGAILNTHGAQNVTVTFENFSQSFDVTVGVKLTGITLDTTYVRKDYFLNRALDLDGLVVNANYSDGSSQPVTNYTSDPAQGTKFETVGQKTITISYQSFNGSYTVNVIDGSTPIVIPEADSSDIFDNTEKAWPDELLVNYRVVSLLEKGNDEEPGPSSTCQLEVLPQPGYPGNNVTFSSSDPAVAEVSSTGLVVGKSSGEAVITVQDNNKADLKAEIKVYVSPEIDADAADALKTTFTELSATEDEKITSLIDNEMYIKTVYRTDANNNTELYSYSRMDQRFVASIDDAYFRVWETDADVDAPQGAMVPVGSMNFTNYDWIFHTDEYYETYVFHQSGDVKTFLDVATQDYLDKENHKRVNPLLDILDNIFNSGSSLFNNIFDRARLSFLTQLIGYGRAKDTHYGQRGENCFFLDTTLRFDDKSTLDDENRYGIPYNSDDITDQRMIFTVENNRIVALNLLLDETYRIGDYDYHAIYTVTHEYKDLSEDKSELYVPPFKDYTEVMDIFDL